MADCVPDALRDAYPDGLSKEDIGSVVRERAMAALAQACVLDWKSLSEVLRQYRVFLMFLSSGLM